MFEDDCMAFVASHLRGAFHGVATILPNTFRGVTSARQRAASAAGDLVGGLDAVDSIRERRGSGSRAGGSNRRSRERLVSHVVVRTRVRFARRKPLWCCVFRPLHIDYAVIIDIATKIGCRHMIELSIYDRRVVQPTSWIAQESSRS
ncbi:hypothetical protein [Gordonia paraffinivorans]|uniref:hypothetical protein n=1 Tax=Gordonia paraffinivorans TaxID=175628 RepID=UPI0014482F70|nr:hypothetical protein [Gordonia paraffinivorans]